MKDVEIEGYTCPIEGGVWHRVKMFGVPRLWAACWTGICGLGFLMILFRGHGLLVLLPIGIWPLGHGILMMLTLWDERFDDVLLASPKYRSRYQ